MGYVKTAMLMAAMTALFMSVGYLIGGSGGAVIALVVAAAMNAFTWWNSDRMALRLHNAQLVAPGDRLGLHALTAELARNANLPAPSVYLIDTPQPNAFATGRNHTKWYLQSQTVWLPRLYDSIIRYYVAIPGRLKPWGLQIPYREL